MRCYPQDVGEEKGGSGAAGLPSAAPQPLFPLPQGEQSPPSNEIRQLIRWKSL